MSTRLHTPSARLQTFESLYQSIERGDDLYDCAVDDDGFVAGIHTDSRDNSVLYAERLPDGRYFGALLKPSFSKRLPKPMERVKNPGQMPERLTHCTARIVVGELDLSGVSSTRDIRSVLVPRIHNGTAKTTKTYQTIHNRGQLHQIYERFVLTAHRESA
jgi:hypothetical protein